jgi:hypothetical protein
MINICYKIIKKRKGKIIFKHDAVLLTKDVIGSFSWESA